LGNDRDKNVLLGENESNDYKNGGRMRTLHSFRRPDENPITGIGTYGITRDDKFVYLEEKRYSLE
jgi:hypothetical protein